MNWTSLESADQITDIKNHAGYSIIFKHSTRCSVSMVVKKRVELDLHKLPENLPHYFLDLIKYRELSNLVATAFDVYHESPQLLVIKDGECVLDLSHGQICIDEAMSVIGEVAES